MSALPPVWLTDRIVGAESADDINLAKQLNVLLTQLGVDGKSIVMNVGTAAAGYGYEYVVSTMDRIKAAALTAGRRHPADADHYSGCV